MQGREGTLERELAITGLRAEIVNDTSLISRVVGALCINADLNYDICIQKMIIIFYFSPLSKGLTANSRHQLSRLQKELFIYFTELIL